MNAKRLPNLLCAAVMIFSASIASSGRVRADNAQRPITIVAFGDSLTAGYQLPRPDGFPAQLQVALEAKGYKVRVVNAGVSGDTTAGGLERLDWTLQSGADAVILELGANDMLRGTDPKIPRANLDKMLGILKAKGLDVLLAGMRATANWGDDYKQLFDAIYPELAAKHAVALYPYLMDGIRADPAYLQADGLHPTAKGVAEIVKRILPDAEALVKTASARVTAGKP
jgi:acyl-CoA thioesterase-1